MPRERPLAAIFAGGLTAGTLDIVYACLSAHLRGRSPFRTVQAVASGLLGSDAFAGGWPTFLLGLLAHFTIALGAATVFYLASRYLAPVRRHLLVSGLLFGIGVYLCMNFVVLPLSAVPFELSYPPRVLLEGFVSHALLVGLPIALCVRRWSSPAPRRQAPG
jgi:hypothetical protein